MANIELNVDLSDADYKRIVTNGCMLNDNHIYEFQKLLKRTSNNGFNVQSTLYVHILDFITPIDKNKKHIQILFSGSEDRGHWICSYYDKIWLYIYDSLNRGFLVEDEIEYLLRLYPFKPRYCCTLKMQNANKEILQNMQVILL